MPPAKTQTVAEQQLEEIQNALASPAMKRLAAEAMEPLPLTGPLRATPSGTIVMELEDLVITFRVPKTGEHRAVTEELPEVSTAPPSADGEAPVVAESDLTRWWRRLADVLGDHPLPAGDDLPPWITINPVLPRRAQNTWVLLPTQAPGT